MLVRIGGGRGGIKEYLENGQKSGREFTRDELDKRLTLTGDLDVTGYIIESFDNDGEKYMHVTFSFYEDEVSEETLKEIVEEYEKFAYAAYDEAEYDLYAEAHIPKIKSYIDNKTGEVVYRKPHIHIVAPRVNLVTGEVLSPLGYDAQNIKFINAFQEHINHKYGLVSPKDRPRHTLNDASDLISRYKADIFKGNMRELKESILNAVIERKIETVEGFKDLLSEYGSIKDNGKYISLQEEGSAKAVRLKDTVFSTEFITTPTEQKLTLLSTEHAPGRTEQGEMRPTPDAVAATLVEWTELRSKELKHLNSGSRREYQQYKNMSREEKLSFLAEKELTHRATHYPEPDNGQQQRNLNDTLRAASNDLQSVSHHLATASQSLRTLESAEPSAGFAAHRANSRIIAAAIQRCIANQEAPTKLVEQSPAERLDEAGKRLIDEPTLAFDTLTRSQSTFKFSDLEKYVQRNTGSEAQMLAALDAILNSPEIVRQVVDGHERFTTREILKIETDLLTSADALAAVNSKAVSTSARENATSTRQFNEGQAQAFDLLTSEKRIAVVNGAAGTGKSYVLAAMREAYEADGYKLYGAILQGKTAEDLERDSGIKSQTMHSFLSALDKGTIRLDKKAVVVVDEAGMIGSRQMQKLLAHVEKSGASIRLVGDVKQLAAVDFGSAFSALSERVPLASLTDIRRQTVAWQSKASVALSQHNIKDAINAYVKHDLVKQAETQTDAKAALVQQWAEDRTADPTKKQIVIAHTNIERKELNRMMRAVLKEQGALGNESTFKTATGLQKFAEHDQIMFTKNDYDSLKIKNGTTATIEKLDGKIIEARLPDGRLLKIDTEHYQHIEHGYALTVYKTQGMTVDRAYLLASNGLTAENAYVGMTRHKDNLSVHYSAEQFKDKAALIKSMSRTSAKEFSAEKPSTNQEIKKSDSVVDHLLRDAKAQQLARKEQGDGREFGTINKALDAHRVLAYVSKMQGVDISLYSVTKGKDGTDRIQVSEKVAYSVSDFLTKEINLDWHTEAKPILRELSAQQHKEVSIEVAQVPKKDLWTDFQRWKRDEYKDQKQTAWQGQSASHADRTATIRTAYAQRKAEIEIKIDPRNHAQRRAELSVARMQRIEQTKNASMQNKTERAQLKASQNVKNADLYRVYLTQKAQAGNAAALAELRRQQKKGVEPIKNSLDALTTSKGAIVADSKILNEPKITYNVTNKGDVIYKMDGRESLRDEARAVVLIETNDAIIETAMRLGIDKFGRELAVNGTEDFQRRAVEIAVEKNIRVTFKNATLEDYKQHLEQQRALPTPARTIEAPAAPAAPAISPAISTAISTAPLTTGSRTMDEGPATPAPTLDRFAALRDAQHAEVIKREAEAAAKAARLAQERAKAIQQAKPSTPTIER